MAGHRKFHLSFKMSKIRRSSLSVQYGLDHRPEKWPGSTAIYWSIPQNALRQVLNYSIQPGIDRLIKHGDGQLKVELADCSSCFVHGTLCSLANYCFSDSQLSYIVHIKYFSFLALSILDWLGVTWSEVYELCFRVSSSIIILLTFATRISCRAMESTNLDSFRIWALSSP